MRPLKRPDELAEMLSVSTKTLSNWRSLRIGPAFIRLQGGLIRYADDDIAAWVAEQAASSRDWMAS